MIVVTRSVPSVRGDAITADLQRRIAAGQKVSIRWRKASATWVIYVGGKILESGASSAAAALSCIEEKYPSIDIKSVDLSGA